MRANAQHKAMSEQEFDADEWMSVLAAAKRLEVPRSKVHMLVMTGVLVSRHVKEVGVIVVSKASVEQERVRRDASGEYRRKRR